MNWERVALKLGTTVKRLEELQDGILKRSAWPYPRLYRFDKAAAGVESGSVVFDNGEIVFGYPKIRRAMVLGAALRRHFKDRVSVQEKMNGYNLRVASIDGEVVALTRGGFICPFSTEVVRQHLNPRIFYDDPQIVLCGEMVGPENPYVPKDVYPVESIEFYLFDISRINSRNMLGVQATNEMAQKYDIKHVPFLGEFRLERATESIFHIVRNLGRKGREGVIIKDPENRVPPLKYTSSESNCSDLRFAFRYYNDFASDFFISRVIREGFQSVEWGEGQEELEARAMRLGMSILDPMCDTIRRRAHEEHIVQQLQIRVKSIQTARDFEQHLRRSGTKAVFDIPEPDGDSYVVRIIKPIMSTNDKTQAILEGQLW